MTLRTSLSIVVLAGGLLACRAIPAAEPPAGPPPANDTCGASGISARWLNALATDEARAGIAARAGSRPVRYYTIGDAITMDYSAQRLNVELGADNRIKRFWCG